MKDNTLQWTEKYRPLDITDIIGHTKNINILTNLISNRSLPHMLFHGAPGTGKTSTIIALLNHIYGDNINLMTFKLDASDDRGINSVREDIKGFAKNDTMFVKGLQIILLDEVDSMTHDAQSALRRIIETYSDTIRFCLICNYDNKIIPAIKSRCAIFYFASIPLLDIKLKLKSILNEEKIKINDKIIDIIAYYAKGDLRKAINSLQVLSINEDITENMCHNILTFPSVYHITQIYKLLLNNLSLKITFLKIKNIIIKNNYSLKNIISEILLKILNNKKCNNNVYKLIIKLGELEIKILKYLNIELYIINLISIFKNIDIDVH